MPLFRGRAVISFLPSLLVVCLAVVALTAAGCGKPRYPLCENDDHCNDDGHKGVCVNGTCVECRTNDQCGTGKQCRAGACVARAGYCDDDTPCPSGFDCKSHTCREGRTSEAPAVQCDDEHPCGSGSRCENGHCVTPPRGGPGCTDFPAPRFDFESPEVRGEARETLKRLSECLTSGSLKGAKVLLTGHCDARGESEFNMSLGAQRAEAVRALLVGLGVGADKVSTSSRGKLDANGQDEAGWENDRRVDIEVR